MNLFTKAKTWWVKRSLDKQERQRLKQIEQLHRWEEYQEKYNDKLHEEYQRQKFLNKMHRLKKSTYTKKMVTWILGICILDIQLSYILACFDLGEPVEGLSNNLARTILGVAFIYMVRAYFDSKAEHKNLDDEAMIRMKMHLSRSVNTALKKAGVTDISADDFIDAVDNNEKSSKSFHININGIDISKSPSYQQGTDSRLTDLQHKIENEVLEASESESESDKDDET